MAIQRQSNLTEAKEWFGRLDADFRANAAIRHLDGNIEIENFFRDLLYQLYGWSLTNANWSESINQDSFDLEDSSNRIAVQVTSTMTAAKIRKTLTSFIENHRSRFARLVFVYPFISKTASKAPFTEQLAGFPFDSDNDRIDLGILLQRIQNLGIAEQEAALRLIRLELKPLGQALQMGVDQTVEVIISIIRHISEATPDPNTPPEFKPDAPGKLERFKAHAEFLKRQFLNNVTCYRAVEEARQAVGYDAARAPRCAAWLREKSLSALENHGNDARLAFESIVSHLVEREHKAGRDCEEQAVRYFLADEFGRCNVFPNPTT
jgi:hypothetical protein